MTNDVLGISISGLRVSQNALRTTGHNIANANTEGYSRQRTEIHSAGATQSGAGFLGNGAYTSSIERVVNDFAIGQVRQDTTLYNELNTYNDNILQLNDLLADSSTGLTQGLESFFNAVQNLTDDPTSTSSQQLFLSEADNLADRFNTLYTRVDNINDGVNQSLSASVNQVNTLATSIAELNQAIGNTATSVAPNDLLDQREEALRQLSELVAISVSEQGDHLNVSIGDGIPLVVGTTTTEIRVEPNEFDQLQPEIFLGNLTQPITDSLSGGEIGGLLDFRETAIQPTLNDLGRTALVLADAFNELQQQGITQNNQFGTNLFFDINDNSVTTSRVLPSTDNQTNDQLLSLDITDTQQLTLSDYSLSVSVNNNYTITRLSDNTEVASGTIPGVLPTSITFDGLSLDITAGTYSAGDEFLIRPTRTAARDFGTMPLQPEDIALGSPVLTDTNLGNLGNASISPGEVLGLVDSSGNPLPLFSQPGELSPPLLVQFTTPTTYDVLDNSDPGNPVQLSPPIRNQTYVPGIQNTLFSDDIGATTVVSTGASLGLPTGSTAVAAGAGVNGYPAETFTFTTTDPVTGAVSSQNAFSTLNASARTTAGLLDNVDGVSATAFNYVELRDFTVSLTAPLQITLNGEDLVQYDGAAIDANVPSPALNSGEDFNDYLAEQINSNSQLTDLGIYAVSAYDATSSEYYIQVHSTQGDDLTVQLEAAAGEVIEVTDGNNPDVVLTGAGAGTVTEVVAGGYIDVYLDSNVTMGTTPATSAIFGTVSASSHYLGIQANITGTPETGDSFTLDFNEDAASDNRNGLLMADLQLTATIGDGDETFNQAYNRLIETVGIQANASELNTSAAESVLRQSVDLRNSISGVNLDEEAADLIRYEQLYSANAQVINVARELFDQLLNSL